MTPNLRFWSVIQTEVVKYETGHVEERSKLCCFFIKNYKVYTSEKSIEADEDKPESSEVVLISEAAAIETSDKESSSEAFYVEQKNKIRKEQIKAKVSQILVRLAYEIYTGSCQARTKYHCRQ